MTILASLKLALGATMLFAVASHASTVVATFDDLPLPPALNSASGLQYTNASNSLVYQGVTWDSHFSVVGDQYQVDVHGGPLFGIPHSGDYFVTNQDGISGMAITTDKVLTGAWFGRNEYYGYGSGADQITITALSGSTSLALVVFDLPENPGQPEPGSLGQPVPLSFVDTSSFAALHGITAYRIDRRELGTQSGNWVADDFQFSDAVSSVPEPGASSMLALGLSLLLLRARRKALKK